MMYYLTYIFVNRNSNHHFCPNDIQLKIAVSYSTNMISIICPRYQAETVLKRVRNKCDWMNLFNTNKKM